jgi:hypothetical protein
MAPARTDLLSEAVDAQPRPLRWLLRVSISIVKFARWIIVLQAIGGLVGIVVGVATLHGVRVVLGVGQVLLAAVLVGTVFDSERVVETSGRAGAFVIRSGKRRLWRDAQGWRRVVKLVSGDFEWAVAVRARGDDPFGPVVHHEEAPTEREAHARADEIGARVRRGEDVAPAAGARQALRVSGRDGGTDAGGNIDP